MYSHIYGNEIDIPRLCKIFILELDQAKDKNENILLFFLGKFFGR